MSFSFFQFILGERQKYQIHAPEILFKIKYYFDYKHIKAVYFLAL